MTTMTRPQPPALRIVRRRTIDVDADAAHLVEQAKHPERTAQRTAPTWIGAVLTLAVIAATLYVLY